MSKIMSKTHGIFFYFNHLFFSGEGRTGNVAEFEEDRLLEIV